MKLEIKSYFENLNPKKLGLKNKIQVKSIKKIGMGTGNANFLVKANEKKFIFRLNMQPKNKKKSKKEFEALKIVERYKISPKAWILDDSRNEFDSDFIILNYTEGKTSNKIKPYLNDNLIKNIARLCGKLHSIKIKGKLKKLKVEPESINYKNSLNFCKKAYINYIRKKVKNKRFLKMIEESYNQLKFKISKEKYISELVLTQGDFCEQNIIVNKNKYFLIDFEYLGIADNAQEIALIFVTFGKPFNKKQQEIFLKEYLKITKNKDEKIQEKIRILIPIKQFVIFLWAIRHSLRIINKEMHSHFLKENLLKEDIKYVKIVFRRCLRMGIIDKKYKNLDIKKVLG